MLLELDGFDGYSLYSQRWQDFGSGVGPLAVGRFGTNGYRNQSGTPRAILKILDGNYTELIAGCAIALGGGGDLIGLYDTTASLTQVLLYANGTELRVYRGNPAEGSAVILASVPGALSNAYGTENYYEIRSLIDNTVGTVEVRINGDTVVSLTGQDTERSSNAFASGVYLGNITLNTTHNNNHDDFYVCDTTDSGIPGRPNDDFLGDIHIETCYANGNGNSSQFDGSDGNQIDNYLLVDETSPDSDTTYVESPDIGDKDTYAFSNLIASTGTIYGVQLNPFAKKTASGTRSIKTVARESGGTEEDGPEQFLGTSYVYYSDIRDGDPDGVAWTIASVNAAEFGQKVSG